MTPHQQILPFLLPCICGKENCDIPYGHCHCRCGQKTVLAARTRRTFISIQGMPQRFIIGHQHRDPYRLRTEEIGPFKLGGVYCRVIGLTKGQITIVRDFDFDEYNQWSWYAAWDPYRRSYYAARSIFLGNRKKENIAMHRQMLGLKRGDEDVADHINGNTLDNRRGSAPEGNLRKANYIQNGANCARSRNNRSGYKGVYWHTRRGKWAAKIQVNYHMIPLGYFETKEEAYAAYCVAARHYFGEFARL